MTTQPRTPTVPPARKRPASASCPQCSPVPALRRGQGDGRRVPGRPRCRARVAGRSRPALATRRWSSKRMRIRSGLFCGSIYWVLLVSGAGFCSKPLSQIQRSTRWLLQGLSPRTSFGGFGLRGSLYRIRGRPWPMWYCLIETLLDNPLIIYNQIYDRCFLNVPGQRSSLSSTRTGPRCGKLGQGVDLLAARIGCAWMPSHAIDLRGHGESGRLDLSHTSMQDYADDVHSVLTQMSQPPVVMGWSMGGLVAMMVAPLEVPSPVSP